MIRLTRLNRMPLILNSDLIEHIEPGQDTVISLTNGQKFLVMETADEVVERVATYQRSLYSAAGCPLAVRERLGTA
ncbi:MAG: flagellar FlbD family protein [Acidobacteria bacterium]|nr:flagellar FlbD family protein [Acidobacteriota bacterium]